MLFFFWFQCRNDSPTLDRGLNVCVCLLFACFIEAYVSLTVCTKCSLAQFIQSDTVRPESVYCQHTFIRKYNRYFLCCCFVYMSVLFFVSRFDFYRATTCFQSCFSSSSSFFSCSFFYYKKIIKYDSLCFFLLSLPI